jgi:hypothetical protein
MNLPRITIVTAAAVPDFQRICNAMGLGTAYLTRKLCAIDPEATHETPATHWFAQDMSAQDVEAPVWQGMAQEADLPPIAGIWGEDGVISALDAQTALSFGNVRVYTAAGENDPTAWRDGILAGAGLQFVPDEPI